MSITFSHTQQLKVLKFQCRRGLAEVEALLMAYWQLLAKNPTDEDAFIEECHLFERLLTQTDQQLFEWLLSPQQVPEAYSALIGRIRRQYLQK